MRILYVTFFYPPHNSIGAVRAEKNVKYLKQLGHDVHVLTALNQGLPETLTDYNFDNSVNYAPWLNINSVVTTILGGQKKVGLDGYPVFEKRFNWLNKLGYWYKTFLNFPDAQIGWYPFGLYFGKKILRKNNFDFIYASAWPITSFLISRKLSKIFHVPWVGEYRDLWRDNPYLASPIWRKKIEELTENIILNSSAGLVAISEPHRSQLKKYYRNQIAVVTNAFEPSETISRSSVRSSKVDLNILHLGTIYPGKRTPVPLFKALQAMREQKHNVRVNFIGRYTETLRPIVLEYGLQEIVQLTSLLSREEALAEQAKADILLLLLWDNPNEVGNYSGKFFDYLGARKPILLIGPRKNVAARLIIKHSLGIVSTRPTSIRRFLLSQLENSSSKIVRDGSDELDLSKYTREHQARILSEFLISLKTKLVEK